MPGGPISGELANLLQPMFDNEEVTLFNSNTAVLSELFPEGQIGGQGGAEAVNGGSEVRWLFQAGRSVAVGAFANRERIPSEERVLTATRTFRGELPADYMAEHVVHYGAEIITPLAVQAAGPLAAQQRQKAETVAQIQRRAAEAALRKMISWHFHGPPDNSLATVNAAVAATLTSFVARRNDAVARAGERGAYCLGAGSPIAFTDQNGVARGIQGYRVTRVRPAAAGDTVDFEPALDVALVAADRVVEGDARRTSFARGVVSIQALVGNAVDSEVIHGRSRITYPGLNSTVLRNPAIGAFRGAAIAALENALANNAAAADMEEGEELYAIMPPGLASEFLFAGGRAAGIAPGPAVGEQPAMEMLRYAQTRTKVMYGFVGFEFLLPSAPGGRIMVLTDPDAQPNTIRIIRRSDFARYTMQPTTWGPGALIEGTSDRIRGFDEAYAVLVSRFALRCKNPGRQLALHQFGHLNILVAQGGMGAAATLA